MLEGEEDVGRSEGRLVLIEIKEVFNVLGNGEGMEKERCNGFGRGLEIERLDIDHEVIGSSRMVVLERHGGQVVEAFT